MYIIYNIGSIALIGISVFAGLNDHILMAILYFLASMVFLFVANVKDIVKDKSAKDGSEIEIEELLHKAEGTIIEMQNLAKLVSKTALALIKRSGRAGGYPEEEQEALKDSFLKLLHDLNISEEERYNVLEEYNKFIEIDYVMLLLQSHIPINWPKEELQKRRDILKNVVTNCPSPERIEELLIRNESLSKNHKDICDDFRYFQKYKKYRRPEMIPKYRELRNTMNL